MSEDEEEDWDRPLTEASHWSRKDTIAVIVLITSMAILLGYPIILFITKDGP